MAEFALGLTKTAVEGTVSRVKSAIDEEEKLKVRVQNDLVFITGEFQMMQSFLNVASKERAKNEVVRTWVRQIRDLAFDVEDCVELVVSLDVKSGWSWLWRVLPGCMAPPRPLDQAVAEIQRLKARVEDVSHRNTRYNLINDSGSDSKTTAQVSPELLPNGDIPSSPFHILREVWEAAGKIRHDMRDLRELLLNNEGRDLEVISLWEGQGSDADLGTMHVLREAYNDQEICQEFKSQAWVKLIRPFNPDEFLRSLLTQFYASSHRAKVLGGDFRRNMRAAVDREDDLTKAQLMQQVSDEQRYLVIVEQLSTVAEWNTIRMYLPDSKNGSRIVVTTKHLGLALSCTGNPYQVSELRQFSYGQSLCALFSKNKGYSDQHKSQFFSSRMIEARDWRKFERIGHQREEYEIDNLRWGNVSSVWGIAGVGKSTLVKKNYFDDMIDTYELQIATYYSWVDVPHAFNLIDLSRRLLVDFHSVDLEAKEIVAVGMMEGQDPIQMCRNFLQENRCFVVIDGLRSIHDWDLIKTSFLSDPIEGLIIVITNNESVATHCVDKQDSVVNIKGLEAHETLNLYTKIAWNGKQLDSENVELSRLIMTKCGGLPKVIVAIGEYHRPFHLPTLNQQDIQQVIKWLLLSTNVDFMSLLETDPAFHCLRGLFSWMQSYFDDCQDYLKPCIFYLSVFPFGDDIRRRRLLRRWIAEGYCRDTSLSTAEENGEKFFSELVKLSIIQQQEKEEELPSKPDVFRVNGFFREYIISRPMQDNLVFALEGRCILNSQHVGQHLTISSSWDRDKILFESMEFSRLRSLTIFGEWRPFFISSDVDMRLLRVLDLEDTTGVTNCDIKQIGKLLPRLKFLSLRGCRYITRLPSSLGGMRQLQTLDIKGTSIATLPLAILKLEKLQYVRAGIMSTSTLNNDHTVAAVARSQPPEIDVASTSQPPHPEAATTTITLMDNDRSNTGQPSAPTVEDDDDGALVSKPRGNMPLDFVFSWLSKMRKHEFVSSALDGVQFPLAAAGGIGKFTALHTLGFINVGVAGGNDILRELKKLTQLRKLRLAGLNGKNWHEFCCTISGHGYLKSLSVRLVEDEQQDLCSISNPPKTLKSLKLYGGNIHVSPVWIKQLDNLTKVQLELTLSTQEDIESYKKLPNTNMYRYICVKPIQDGELCYGMWEYGVTLSVLPGSEFLKIECGSYRLRLVFGSFFPEYFVVLVVHCSTTEASLELSGLENLLSLEEVWLKGTYSEAVKQHLQQTVDEHRNKPVLKLEGQQIHPTPPSAE